ncbi:MAG: type II toxin-antitoxin system VapC family toxin [Treponema sp.]|nr:type II toxin-antitoxin system VapC family toxin [Treponema sp.]
MYLLDTNICVYTINNRPSSVRAKLKETDYRLVHLSSVSFAELQYGAYKSCKTEESKKALRDFVKPFDLLDFNGEDAEAFGAIRAYLEKKGLVIGPYDMQIAAQALTRNLILVTNNIREFERIPHLRLENWAEETAL